ncbi:LytR family transcriptional attenuator [Saccharopolyspora erythraea NRRL 2338]|uniref:Probable transcriptional regulator, LytR family n=4 Tax=Saccharopolyspora erythraea TaxID=1836 RepID=A4FD71_SACEN|nr:LCP family protein [Saccharopolyspora erythraea]PFG95743.1 LytR family transcriptional attenuator [Saccharopolyspora erythraea NRRL 2338]QRK92337.1 LCP family protein [Saccharopolyspora erythraea]CAM01996.1 probable transcriptional regulator, LytR family [Saccharopolyspora erythraea NRRL 2338]
MTYTQPGYRARGRTPEPRVRRRRWGRKVVAVLVVLVLALVGFVLYVDYSLKREQALPVDGERPQDGPGTNWLLVGSDSREDLDQERKDELGTGDTAGRRTDTVMLVHIPESGGTPTMVSLPRDSLVKIPGQGKDKLNAAFAYGGSQLLARTVENNTGVRIDHYAEVGLGGFADITDAIGGVDLCVKEPMQDPKANLDLQPGCQTLQGPQALGYVRTRATARGDLDRVQRQREFLAALTEKVSGPEVLANPFRLFPLILDTSQSFLVDSGDHVWHLGSLGLAMQGIASGQGVTTTVPFGGFGETDGGASVVEWDDEGAEKLFGALATDTPVPQEVITTAEGIGG